MKTKFGQRHGRGKHFPDRSRRPRPAQLAAADIRLRNRILTVLFFSSDPISSNDLAKKLGLPRSGRQDVERLMMGLERDGLVRQTGKKGFLLQARSPLTEAIIDMSPSGHAFARLLSSRHGSTDEGREKDAYVPPARLSTALPGDRVLAFVTPSRRPGKKEAEVLHILQRANLRVAGFFHKGGHCGVVHPDDSRFPFAIALVAPPPQPVEDGHAVLVSLLYDADNTHPRGEIVEVLGDPGQVTVQVRLIIEKFRLPHRFSDEAEQQARFPPPDPAAGSRKDLRQTLHVTIDGTDAKDFDDAIAVVALPDGYRLMVSIADVSAHVVVGSALDLEAYERGTSVYLPSTVVPMLPENLSNNLCSLVPDADRLAVTVTIDFDRHGKRLRTSFARTIIRSKHRFTYDTVEQIVTARDQSVRERHATFVALLDRAAELARILHAARRSRGAIGFTLPEAVVLFDDDGQVTAVKRSVRLFAHQIIEEFMLAANEAVAETFVSTGADLLFRIHEPPEPEKIGDFQTFARTLGLDLPDNPATPTWYNRLIEQVEGTPYEYIINNLLLRTMQQARYRAEHSGHFGLASDQYTHFTSPIRRYPDLIVHRQLCRLIRAGKPAAGTTAPPERSSPTGQLPEDARHLSDRERIAVAAEREMVDRLACRFMSRHLGETFSAVISGVSETAFFVELLDFAVSGIVALSALTDDYYLLDQKRHRLVGDISGQTLQIGDLIQVVLAAIDFDQNKLQFSLKQPRKRRKNAAPH